MVFSSPIFLFGFLPILLLIYYGSPKQLKNSVLLFASLLFYAWGEVFYILVMLISIAINYVLGRAIYRSQETDNHNLSRASIVIAIAANLLLLISFKYANFLADNINQVLSLVDIPKIELQPIHLPLGISFFTFQAISYIVDIYRKKIPAQKNIFHLALYISLFPQLIAGPIVRYVDISKQIINRSHSVELFSSGAHRFITGLAKKMLIANPLGEVADAAFSLSGNELTTPVAWIGIIAYSLQIFFDFSGYSDMAIGLGRMLGFRFLENFNLPYIARSVREFWRRWHISLSTWFRDYVYIPLGGNRASTPRVAFNLVTVFLLTGIWHGASWNFIVWGLFHGFFLACEHFGFSRILDRLWRPLQHVYLLLIVTLGWVFFRSENLAQSQDYLAAMFGLGNINALSIHPLEILTNEALIALFLGVILSTPLLGKIKTFFSEKPSAHSLPGIYTAGVLNICSLIFISYLCAIKIASSTYNPFIYFRF
ncbi:MBOAT family protein [Microbulbifer sp. ALW1]|uniref:MBOAT family O-acyltransferase n=1 Tax=Microbulbifer sp. (strain ALW1) TaxID=1516059 RepID=UPI00135C2EF9|nr:MBOAT family protein [Microbulbifer sp. ALW1]